jgi:hypothetical protein
MACNPLDPTTCVQWALGSTVSSAGSTAWNVICRSFADGAAQLLQAFGHAFATLPDLNLVASGIASPYGISLVIGSVVAALLIIGQVMRTAWTRDGTGMAQALTGTVKAVLAWLLTASVATAALAAADAMTRYIVDASFGSQQGLAGKLASVVNWSVVIPIPPAQAAQATVSESLLMIIAVIGIVLVIVLWFELLLRNAALAVLIAVSPIAAAGQAGGEATRAWWPRTVLASAHLIILKPVMALVFAVGFGMTGNSTGISALLQGLLVLGLAVFAWPVIARFFTFTSVQAASAGLAGLLGFAVGVTAARAGGGGGQGTAGVRPELFSRASEGRVMGARGADAGGMGSAGGGGGTGGAVLGGIGFVLGKAQQAGTLLAGRLEQTAGHAGMPGAYPYSTIPGGQQRIAPRRTGTAAAAPRQDGLADRGPVGANDWPGTGPDGDRERTRGTSTGPWLPESAAPGDDPGEF